MVVEKPDPLELDFRTVFTSEAGERVLYNLMKKSFIWEGTYSESSITMAHNEGRRDVVVYILNMVGKKMENPTTYADESAIADMNEHET